MTMKITSQQLDPIVTIVSLIVLAAGFELLANILATVCLLLALLIAWKLLSHSLTDIREQLRIERRRHKKAKVKSQ